MKRFFSLFFIIAILCLAMILVSCGKKEEAKPEVKLPEIDNPVSAEYHEHAVTKNIVKPTCVSGGYTEYVCTVCDYVYRDTFTDRVKNAHQYSAYTTTVTPTCQTNKVEKRTCLLCGNVDSKIGGVVPHSYGSFTTVKSPTCTEEGLEERFCVYCGGSDTRTISKLSHNYGAYETKQDATCQQGKIEVKMCLDCGYEYKRTSDPLPHNYSEFVEKVDSGCLTDGHETYKCSMCAKTKTTIFPAHHTFTDWTVDIPNVNTLGECVIGSESRDCTVCELHEQRDIPAHNFVDTVVAPTCAEMGYTEHVCENCGFTYLDNYKSATGEHNFSAWVDYPGYPGYKTHSCDTCGYIDYKED